MPSAELDVAIQDIGKPARALRISATADLLASVYEEHKDRIYIDPKTGEPDPMPGAMQLVFCDFGPPSDRWNVYGELEDQLRRRGVPEHMVRLSRLDRAYNRNMVAVAHTKRGEQSAADAASTDLPLI